MGLGLGSHTLHPPLGLVQYRTCTYAVCMWEEVETGQTRDRAVSAVIIQIS